MRFSRPRLGMTTMWVAGYRCRSMGGGARINPLPETAAIVVWLCPAEAG